MHNSFAVLAFAIGKVQCADLCRGRHRHLRKRDRTRCVWTKTFWDHFVLQTFAFRTHSHVATCCQGQVSTRHARSSLALNGFSSTTVTYIYRGNPVLAPVLHCFLRGGPASWPSLKNEPRAQNAPNRWITGGANRWNVGTIGTNPCNCTWLQTFRAFSGKRMRVKQR